MKFKRAYLVFLSSLLISCSNESPYEIKDAGMSAMENSIHWLNNENLIFINWEQGRKSIYTWDTVKNKVKLHRANVDSNICYSNGYITYRSRKEDGKIFHRSGMFPDEEEYSSDLIDKGSKFNRYSCKRFMPPEEHRYKNIHYLKEEHGFIELGPKRKNEYEFPVYISPEGERIKIDYRYDWYYNRPQSYYPFRGGYFIFKPFLPVWDGSGCNPGIWIYPEGKVESECVPFISAVKNYGNAIPVFGGYLIISFEVESNTEVGESGLYYFNKYLHDINLIYTGINKDISVSPNGCKVAFVHNPVVNKDKKLKMINICN